MNAKCFLMKKAANHLLTLRSEIISPKTTADTIAEKAKEYDAAVKAYEALGFTITAYDNGEHYVSFGGCGAIYKLDAERIMKDNEVKTI